MGLMNLDLARERMAAAGLEALLLLSPRHMYYATGYKPWFLSMYGEAGYGAVVIPLDRAMPSGAIISDVEEGPFCETAPDFPLVRTYPSWVAYASVPPLSDGNGLAHLSSHVLDQPLTRAGLIDPKEALVHLADLVHTMRIDQARIGIEAGFLSAMAREWLTVAAPDVQFVDATSLLEELRAIKSPTEVSLLRRGTVIAEQAITAVTTAIRPNMTVSEIAQNYRAAVMAHADGGDVTSARITLRVGPHVLSSQASSSYVVRPGDVVFLDCGVEVAGYWADMGRTFVLGPATPVQRQIYEALRASFEEAVANLRPGLLAAQVFVKGMEMAHGHGLTSYIRGNLGHGVGLQPAPELPIISRGETRWLAPGHVVSVECPYYVDGIGAFTIEDTFAMDSDGREVFNRLSRDLVELDG